MFLSSAPRSDATAIWCCILRIAVMTTAPWRFRTVKSIVRTEKAPAAIGPYSQAVICQGMVYISGQIPLDPFTGAVEEGDIAQQTKRVLTNLDAVLQASGASLASVVKTTVYLKNMGDFPAMNEVYAQFFGESLPARATVEVSRLPKDVAVEIDAIAEVGG